MVMEQVEPLVLSSKQKDFYLNSTAQINISHGAVRSGKTFINNLRWLKYIKEGPKGKLLMSGKTKQSIKDNVLSDIFDLIGEGNYRYWEQKGELIIFDRKIKVVGADSIDAETKIRGQTYAGWYGDEITIQHPTFVKQAITRCSVADAQIFWTTNPDHPKHYIKRDFIDDKEMIAEGQVKNWHFFLDDNATLTEKYKKLLKASFAGVFYKRNIDGLWVIAEGIVYGDDYKPVIHKLPASTIADMIKRKAFREYIGGTDFGYTHAMTGMIYGITGADPLYPEYYQVCEFYKHKEKTETLVSWYLKWEERLEKKLRIIYCDSAEPDRIITMQEAGLRATGANKELNAGINTVMTVFKNDRLFISDDCVETDNELSVYRYPDENDQKANKDKPLKDVPIDDDNHAMDAKRYAIHNYELHLIGQRNADKKRKSREEKREALLNKPKKRRR